MEHESPVLVALTGLPGTGKSALADGLAAALACPVYSVDPLEAVLLRAGIGREERSDYAAYDLAAFCAEDQLRRRQSAIVDAVNALPRLRTWWADIASRNGCAFRLIYTVCSDPGLHRSRLEHRRRDLPGFPFEPTWDEVAARRFDPPALPHLRLDAVDALAGNVARAVAYATVARAGGDGGQVRGTLPRRPGDER